MAAGMPAPEATASTWLWGLSTRNRLEVAHRCRRQNRRAVSRELVGEGFRSGADERVTFDDLDRHSPQVEVVIDRLVIFRSADAARCCATVR